MFNCFDKLFSTETLPNGFQSANLADTKFIFKLILREASLGHFNDDYLCADVRKGLRKQIQSSITQHKCPTHRGTTSKSAIYIYRDGNSPIGFSWVLETEQRGEEELYLLAVSPNHREKGIGKILVSETISHYPPQTKFIARTLPASHTMRQILIAMGFKQMQSRGKDTVCLSYTSS